MPGKHVIEPSEHAGLNRSINRVFSLPDTPQAGARAEQFGGPFPPHAARQRTYDILSPSLQENVRTLLSGWASMAETKGRECG